MFNHFSRANLHTGSCAHDSATREDLVQFKRYVTFAASPLLHLSSVHRVLAAA